MTMQKTNRFDLNFNQIVKWTIIAGVILGVAMLLLSNDGSRMLLGLVFGLVFSILNFRLLHLTIKKSLEMHPARAQSYVTSRYFLRYFLAGAVLYVAISNEAMHVLGTITGLLMIKFVILASNVISGIKKTQDTK
ncbi:ATP synthase subunit I [Alkalibacter saccharofermentans]|uniref:ATP synthase I chain n=1 Tax=Alkalibacter saccharofermentans DSM 14828 TaxID=1120975 RepID=A0A1M4Y351_9FIRM|nr:ATP synthase subunit I [Alkalibacter saccharofermentans]SHF00181.1 ATP synthase I chain [Alkalibacter saccharofermentans DSM 14828]